MTTPPTLTMPDSSCVADVVMSMTRVVGSTTSPYTLQDQNFKWPGEKWEASFNMPPILNRAIANQWKAFGVKLEGRFGQFYFGDPSAKEPLGVGTGTPLVDGAGQNGNTLNTKGWTPGVTGILKAGDYIQVGTGTSSRLHMVVEDADSDTSGDAVLTIQPALRYSPADNLALNVNSPVGVFKMTSNTFSWSVRPGPIYTIGFQAEEVIGA